VIPLIVDASVVAKWYLNDESEPLVPAAFRILEQYAQGEIQFLVPDLFWAEVGNIFWKSVRQGRQTKLQAQAALRSLERRQFTTIPSLSLLAAALPIATGFDRSFYDSLYIAAALEFQSRFITADYKLARAVGSELPVTWLGAS